MTDRYMGTHGIQPEGVAAALTVSAAMVSGLVMSSPAVQQAIERTLIVHNIPRPKPTVEPTPETRPIVAQTTLLAPPRRPVDTTDPVVKSIDAPFVLPTVPGSAGGTGTGPVAIIPPPSLPTPSPVLSGPSIDPRYARDLQPLYPASEQRAGRSGLVTVRVLVGTDGRVRQVEPVAAASAAFFAATERQALARWRFRPATRDGVPIEAWRTMTVRFELPE